MLHSQGLEFAYNSQLRFSFPDLHCEPGHHLVILGQSGRGKTTLLHLLAGFLLPHAGEVRVGQQEITRLSTAARDHFRGRHIGIVFQRSYFISSLNVMENLLMAQYLAGVTQDKARIQQLLDRLNVGEKASQSPRTLSQGEQQRVAIARAVLNRPQVILADEPTSALDDLNCNEVIHLLEEQAAEAEASLLIVTHDHRVSQAFQHKIELA